jgi:hypothetical protein
VPRTPNRRYTSTASHAAFLVILSLFLGPLQRLPAFFEWTRHEQVAIARNPRFGADFHVVDHELAPINMATALKFPERAEYGCRRARVGTTLLTRRRFPTRRRWC